MDAYAHVLEALQSDSYRRLRAYKPRPGAQFTTWLVVVTRRLLLDYHRHRYGRSRSEDDSWRAEAVVRRQLEDLVAGRLDPERLAASAATGPDAAVRYQQLRDALGDAVAELDSADRLLLALRFEDGRAMREIAAVLRMPTVFHAYRRIGVVLAALRRGLGRRGIEGPEP
jgi:RNA polymerase sigma factor (sigma-70 family)